MGKNDKTKEKILGGKSDKNIRFAGVVSFLLALGFSHRIRGSHNIFSRNDIPELINLQPKGKQCKAYQVKQLREFLKRHDL